MNEFLPIAHCSRHDTCGRPWDGPELNRPDRVVVINDISVMRGGATGVALASIRYLLSLGLPVTFITGDDGSEADPQIADVISAIGGRHILQGGRAQAMLRGVYNRAAAQYLSSWIARHDTPKTVYHLHGWSKTLSPAVFEALKPVAKRLVVHAHDFFLSCPNGGYFNFQQDRPCLLTPLSTACLTCNCDRRSYAQKIWRATRLAMRHHLLGLHSVGRILAVHEAMVPLLQRGAFADAAIDVLRNPVEPWCTDRVPAEHNRTFIFVGRLDADKGADLLAAAARRAGVSLRMIGAGPLAEKLAREFPEIELAGWKDRRDIAALCQDARAIVMPSRSRETFGLSALEALTSGLPAIVSSQALLAAEVVQGGLGFDCDPHDEASLAELLAQVAGNDEVVAQMSLTAYRHARALAPTPWDWSARLMRIYSDVLDTAHQSTGVSPGGGGKQRPAI